MARREVFMVHGPDQYVAYREGRVGDFDNWEHLKNRENRVLHLRGLEYTLFQERLYLCVSRYSRGDSLENLGYYFRGDVLTALDTYAQSDLWLPFDFSDLEEYVCALWSVSLASLFGAGQKAFRTLVSNVGVAGQDCLYDRLVRFYLPDHPVADDFSFPEPYARLSPVLNGEAVEDIGATIWDFLRHYYAGMKACSWYDLHMAENAGFFGYWCFELAALVNGYGIEDKGFVDNLFYPRDLTRARLFRTWLDDEEGEADRKAVEEL